MHAGLLLKSRLRCRRSLWLLKNWLCYPTVVLVVGLTLFWSTNEALSDEGAGREDRKAGSLALGIDLKKVAPDPRGGKAYRLTYEVPVDVETYWRFKTDFSSPIVEDNRYIESHRLVSHKDRTAVTEDVYTYAPKHIFRWQTTVNAHPRRLDFQLLNAAECGQAFHHGSILVEVSKTGTRVIQTAYFDFWGATLWYHSPWSGGMRAFLRYQAHWEQQLAPRLKRRYGRP